MKLTYIIIAGLAALATAQAPKGKGGKPPGGGGKGGMAPKAGGGKGMPGGGMGGKGGGGMPGGGMGGKGGAGGAGKLGGLSCALGCVKEPMQAASCQLPRPTAPPTPAADGAPPAKGSIDPAAISSAKSCLCKAPAIQSAIQNCVPTACATGGGNATQVQNLFNGICKGVDGFTAMTLGPAAPAAASAGSAGSAPKETGA